ncbi:MAG TPA: type III pantothenate kinase [Casimicrobiaceae bacterium]|nr:type III pantothenate kinase [Casimicrobiaceae bacterium]
MQILVIDIGNSRMKWGLHGPRGWMAQGVVLNQDIGTLALRDWQNLPRPVRAVGVNVAGEAARVRVEGQLSRWRVPVEWLFASAQAGGVVNRYAKPSQLGPDRWAAMIAARRRVLSGEQYPPPCVVVNAGTAVTVDALDADGVFLGGIILPGLRLMLQALADHTASLKVPPGDFRDFPTSTADALYTGVLNAACGAVELMRLRLHRDDTSVKCYLAGGAAHELAPHLAGPLEVVDNLVLEGVLLLAEQG